jgi:hypothetical protein
MKEREAENQPEVPRDKEKVGMKRAVSRRSLLTEELSRASLQMARQLPTLAPLLGAVLKETGAQRDRRLVRELWQLLMGRAPKPEEGAASVELVQKARTPEEKGDALADILWALCQTPEFSALGRSDGALVRGFYRLALRRDPTEAEEGAARGVLDSATEHDERVAGFEGMFTALIRSAESVLRRQPAL